MEEKEYTREELIEYGRAHYPKLYWIKRGIGLVLLVASIVTIIGAYQSHYPIDNKFEENQFVGCWIMAFWMFAGACVLIGLSFKKPSDAACIIHAKKCLGITERELAQNQIRESKDVDLLIKYKELLDKGVITQEEFDAKKKELLK